MRGSDAEASRLGLAVSPTIDITYWVTDTLEEQPPVGALEMLGPDERERCARFRCGRDRRDYAAAHALLRATLSAVAGGGPRGWTFEVAANGKPSVAPALGARASLSFNLTHTRGLVACAVVSDPGIDVGIDAEVIEWRPDLLGVARRYFANAEASEVARRGGRERENRFFEIWTLKEAFIKAVGDGLSIPLRTFAFSFDRDGLVTLESGARDPLSWRFALFAPLERYRMALAFRDPSSIPRSVTVRRATSAERCVGESASVLRASAFVVFETNASLLSHAQWNAVSHAKAREPEPPPNANGHLTW
jgi:4'-phosphopantetheinyl transferase